ncbi:MAG: hypothetical protein ACOC1X_03460, partial [Promethearchaeota archaeon]
MAAVENVEMIDINSSPKEGEYVNITWRVYVSGDEKLKINTHFALEIPTEDKEDIDGGIADEYLNYLEGEIWTEGHVLDKDDDYCFYEYIGEEDGNNVYEASRDVLDTSGYYYDELDEYNIKLQIQNRDGDSLATTYEKIFISPLDNIEIMNMSPIGEALDPIETSYQFDMNRVRKEAEQEFPGIHLLIGENSNPPNYSIENESIIDGFSKLFYTTTKHSEIPKDYITLEYALFPGKKYEEIPRQEGYNFITRKIFMLLYNSEISRTSLSEEQKMDSLPYYEQKDSHEGTGGHRLYSEIEADPEKNKYIIKTYLQVGVDEEVILYNPETAEMYGEVIESELVKKDEDFKENINIQIYEMYGDRRVDGKYTDSINMSSESEVFNIGDTDLVTHIKNGRKSFEIEMVIGDIYKNGDFHRNRDTEKVNLQYFYENNVLLALKSNITSDIISEEGDWFSNEKYSNWYNGDPEEKDFVIMSFLLIRELTMSQSSESANTYEVNLTLEKLDISTYDYKYDYPRNIGDLNLSGMSNDEDIYTPKMKEEEEEEEESGRNRGTSDDTSNYSEIGGRTRDI